ncbi:MAG TPA: site-2 protease family protein [Solirubrobacteraceae bacterium]|nr:site-2 protease family protein [Solirubrobacteraceae bacterium]
MESSASWLRPPTPTPAAPAPPERPLFEPPLGPDKGRAARGRQSWLARRAGPALAALVALLAKLKALLLLLPKLKLLTTVGTMLVSVAAYSFVFGWAFAAGFVVLLLVHEMGHVIQLRREGVKASAPMFIPFLGAVISARSLGSSALAEARVGLAGPVLGTIGSAACIVLWQLTGNELWRALAFTGFFLNLFNLLPVVPLDGGRAMAAMAPWMWLVGLAAMVPLALVFPNPVMWLILLLAGFETYKRWKLRRRGYPAQREYYRVRPRNRALVALVYLGLIALLVTGMHFTALARSFA